MAGWAAQPGAELLTFEKFLDSSAQRLTYGYGRHSLSELRAREFGRLAGEVGGHLHPTVRAAGLGGRGVRNPHEKEVL